MIDKKILYESGFSGFTFPNKINYHQMMAWCSYIDDIGFLTFRVIYINNKWDVDLVVIDYSNVKDDRLDWIKCSSIDEVVRYVQHVGTNRL